MYEGDTALIHLHILEKDTNEFKNHLIFRDRLKANIMLRDEYNQLKHKLINSGLNRE